LIEGKSVLAIIPARGGSKGLPRKNIRKLAGKPLIAWTIEEAKKSKYIDRLILSSDDVEIISVARAYGCEVPFVRPRELAGDDTPGIAPVLHAIAVVSETYDYVVLLQPTSPLREAGDIDGCIERCISESRFSCVTVSKADQSPYWMYIVNSDNSIAPIIKSTNYIRRQDLPEVYVLNGAVYVANVAWLKKNKRFVYEETVALIMPENRAVDIDAEEDFIRAQKYLEV